MFEGARRCRVLKDMVARGDLFTDIGPIACPVTILYGTRDRILRWPSHFSRMRRSLSEANWVALEGQGHLPMWDAPDVVTAAILRQTAPAS